MPAACSVTAVASMIKKAVKRAGLRVGRDAARVVVGDACDEAEVDVRERMLLQTRE
jgi:hypothetical protein